MLDAGPHRIELWIESPGCSVHSATILVKQDGNWELEMAVERAECAYSGTLKIKAARINGRMRKPLREDFHWSLMGDPIQLVFHDE